VTLKLKTILSFTHGITTLVTLGFIILLTSNLIDKQFVNFVIDNNQQRIESIIRDVTHQYEEGWNFQKLEETSLRGLEDGFVISIFDNNGKSIYSVNTLFRAETEAVLNSIDLNMKEHYKDWNGELVSLSIPLSHSNEHFGELVITYYSPFFFTELESKLITSVHDVMNITSIFSLIGAIVIGVIISMQISIPITRTIKATRELANGNVNNSISLKSQISEINDLSESVNLLAKNLQKHETIRKRIVSDVSHELRTPLTALQINLEALVDGIIQPTQDRLSGIYKEVLRVNRLVGDLTQLTKYENKSEILNLTTFNLTDLIYTIKISLESKAKNQELDLLVDSSVQDIVGDSDKLSQVLVNLVSNSIKYSRKGGTILLSSFENETDIIIRVKDEGLGIPTEDLPFIFERFYRVDQSRDKETGGAGIGLTITKEIVEAHGGKITIDSNPGHGTDVVVSLPKRI